MQKLALGIATLTFSLNAVATDVNSSENEMTFFTTIDAQCGLNVTDDIGTIGPKAESGEPLTGDPAETTIINNYNDVTVVTALVHYDGHLFDNDNDSHFRWSVVNPRSQAILESGTLDSDEFSFEVPRIKNATDVAIYVSQNDDEELMAGDHELRLSLSVACQ